jgi:hypothetical protein
MQFQNGIMRLLRYSLICNVGCFGSFIEMPVGKCTLDGEFFFLTIVGKNVESFN